jgi:rubrerythrin
MPSLKESRTEANLKGAFAGQPAANRHLRLVPKAEARCGDAAAITAAVETGHAFGRLDYLAAVDGAAGGGPPDNTADNLAAAIAMIHEHTSMYPGMARTAHEEGFEEIADWFATLAKAWRSSARQLQRLLDNLK